MSDDSCEDIFQKAKQKWKEYDQSAYADVIARLKRIEERIDSIEWILIGGFVLTLILIVKSCVFT